VKGKGRFALGFWLLLPAGAASAADLAEVQKATWAPACS